MSEAINFSTEFLNSACGGVFTYHGVATDVDQCNVPGWWVTNDKTASTSMPGGETIFGVLEFLPRLQGGIQRLTSQNATPRILVRSKASGGTVYGNWHEVQLKPVN